MKINISYFLEEHGWSTCWIFANGKLHEMCITHIFEEDPIEECLNALIGIMKGEEERKFIWYGEPGGAQVTIKEIPAKKHMVYFKAEDFGGNYGDIIKDLELSIEFEIKKKQLVRIFYFEFKKISELMKDKHYKENRKHEFPHGRFRDFEKIALEFIELA